jgi:hypothetical protein
VARDRLLLFPGVEGRLHDQGVLISNGEHYFERPRIFHGDLMDQGRVPKSLLEEHENRLVVNLRDDISPVAEMLDELLEGLSLLLDKASYVPVHSRMCSCGMEVTGE